MLRLVRRSPVVFVLAMVVALGMVLISEVSYWSAQRTLDELRDNATARDDIQGLRQSVLAAHSAQRSYLLTHRPEYLAPYQLGLDEIQQRFAALQARYQTSPGSSAILGRLQQAVDTVLAQLVHKLQQTTQDQAKAEAEIDIAQMQSIHQLSDELLELESQNAASSQYDIDQTLLRSRFGVALLSAISLLALVMYLRQSFALTRQQQAVQHLAQSERDRLEIEVRQRTAQLTELTQHLQTAREDERHRLARNLHDDLGALLTAAKLDAARIRSRLVGAGAAPEALELLAHLVATLDTGIALGRRIIEDLRPSALSNLGLVATLEILAGEFAAHSGVAVHCALEPVDLSEAAELMVYRLVQEGMTNISKHAKAHQIWLSLSQAMGQVEVTVRDDGVGFDTGGQRRSAYGLVGMRFRVEAEGGSLRVRSTPGAGTQIQVRLPAHTSPA